MTRRLLCALLGHRPGRLNLARTAGGGWRVSCSRCAPRPDRHDPSACPTRRHARPVGMPDPGGVPCTDCGHLGDDLRHEYDHYLGYAAEHHEDVQAVCSQCHHDRSDRRGETPLRSRDERGRYAPQEVMPCGTDHQD